VDLSRPSSLVSSKCSNILAGLPAITEYLHKTLWCQLNY
jgi:hypothetical protein